jgi:hypothetical protein
MIFLLIEEELAPELLRASSSGGARQSMYSATSEKRGYPGAGTSQQGVDTVTSQQRGDTSESLLPDSHTSESDSQQRVDTSDLPALVGLAPEWAC